MTTMQSTQFRSIVEPILNEAFDGVYDQRDNEYLQVFKERSDVPQRNYFEQPVLFGFGAAPEMPEGTPVTYRAGGVLFIKRYIYKVYGMAFALTEVLIEDGDHINLGRTYSEHLAQSLTETLETNTANVLNRAFNANFAGGDGSALTVNNHPLITGTASNLLNTAANLSQTSLEQMLIQVRNDAVDNNGRKIKVTPKKLVVAPGNMLQAQVLTKSVLRTGTANNDINPVKAMGLLSEDTAVITRLTSSTAWWVQTDAKNGLQVIMRRKMKRGMEGDFETGNTRYKASMRYDSGWTDWRCVWGTPGV